MGCCKSRQTEQNIIDRCYSRFDAILLPSQLQQMNEILQSESQKLSMKQSQIKYPHIVGNNQKKSFIIYKQESGKSDTAKLFYGQVIQSQMSESGLIIFQDKTAFKGKIAKHQNQVVKIYGSLFNENGDKVLEGKWADNKFVEGHIFTDHNIIIKFKNKKYQIEYSDRSTYSGNGKILNHKFVKQGKGIFISGDEKYKYDGFWYDNKKNGKGMARYIRDDGEIELFEGQFIKDQKNGKGKYIQEGSQGKIVFEGTWKGNNKFRGEIRIKQQVKKIAINWPDSEKDSHER